MTDIEHYWKLNLTEENILKAEGADPALIKSRKPALYKAASRALELGLQLVKPVLASSTYPVVSIQHQDILLDNHARIRSPMLVNHFKNAQTLIFCVCSIGDELENMARHFGSTDPVLSMALDALGSAAVEQLMMEICRNLEEKLSSASTYISQPIGPGLEGWTVSDGQPQIFGLVDAGRAGIRLSESRMMLPIKSASFVLGISNTPFQAGSTCDFCNLRETCRYKGNHAQG
jgi:hypothetical protein